MLTALTPLPPCFPENRVPPEALKEQLQASSMSQNFTASDPSQDLSTHDWDLWSCDKPRLDEPDPTLLETRGITQDPATPSEANKHPERQLEFWKKHTTWKMTVAAKLRLAGMHDDALTLETCHSTFTVAVCSDCGTIKRFSNRCENFFCPECQPRLAHDRNYAVDWWVPLVRHPKHATLTVKNIADLTSGHVHQLRKWWNNLRNRKFAKSWRGGFYTIEVTNEGKGWHLHLHAFIDADWIDQTTLSDQWNQVTNGYGRIVKVRGASGGDFKREVAKYIVKGSMIATWSPDQLATFVRAFRGVRTFGVFGSLYSARTEFSAWIAELREKKPRCTCGSCNVKYYSELEFAMLDLAPDLKIAPRPPPPPPEPELAANFGRNSGWPD